MDTFYCTRPRVSHLETNKTVQLFFHWELQDEGCWVKICIHVDSVSLVFIFWRKVNHQETVWFLGCVAKHMQEGIKTHPG